MKAWNAIVAVVALSLFSAAALAGINWSSTTYAGRNKTIEVVTAEVQSNVSGTASSAVALNGTVLRATVVPQQRAYFVTTNTLQAWPIDSWDCTLTDQDGVDLMAGQLANNLMTTSRSIDLFRLLTTGVSGLPVPSAGSLYNVGNATLACTGMGTFRNATMRFYVER